MKPTRQSPHAPTRIGRYIFTLLNQTSLIEALVIPVTLPVMSLPAPPFTFANVEYLAAPLIGWETAAFGAVPVVRGWGWSRVAARARAETRLRAGESMYISVEGRRSPDGRRGPYLHGAAAMALATGATLVPLVLHGARAVLPFGASRPQPGALRAVLCKPVPAPSRACLAGTETRRAAIAALTTALEDVARAELDPRP